MVKKPLFIKMCLILVLQKKKNKNGIINLHNFHQSLICIWWMHLNLSWALYAHGEYRLEACAFLRGEVKSFLCSTTGHSKPEGKNCWGVCLKTYIRTHWRVEYLENTFFLKCFWCTKKVKVILNTNTQCIKVVFLPIWKTELKEYQL